MINLQILFIIIILLCIFITFIVYNIYHLLEELDIRSKNSFAYLGELYSFYERHVKGVTFEVCRRLQGADRDVLCDGMWSECGLSCERTWNGSTAGCSVPFAPHCAPGQDECPRGVVP